MSDWNNFFRTFRGIRDQALDSQTGGAWSALKYGNKGAETFEETPTRSGAVAPTAIPSIWLWVIGALALWNAQTQRSALTVYRHFKSRRRSGNYRRRKRRRR